VLELPPDPPTPGACTKFIVDGGSIDAEKEGDEGCGGFNGFVMVVVVVASD
jgi:hypothetical protein